MSYYRFRAPLEASQYDHPTNAEQVFSLLNVSGGASFVTDRGHMRRWNLPGARAVEVADQDWVIMVDRQFMILSNSEFHSLLESDETAP